jgi:hypothetical protein
MNKLRSKDQRMHPMRSPSQQVRSNASQSNVSMFNDQTARADITMNECSNLGHKGKNKEKLKFLPTEVDLDLLNEGSANESSSSSKAGMPSPRARSDFLARPATPKKRQY